MRRRIKSTHNPADLGSPSKRTCGWEVTDIGAGHGSKVPVRPVTRGVALTCTTPVKWRARTPIIRSCVRLFLAAWLSTYQGVLGR